MLLDVLTLLLPAPALKVTMWETDDTLTLAAASCPPPPLISIIGVSI